MRDAAHDADGRVAVARAGFRPIFDQALEAWRSYSLFVAQHELNRLSRAKNAASNLLEETSLDFNSCGVTA